jgi:hypothetical protein
MSRKGWITLPFAGSTETSLPVRSDATTAYIRFGMFAVSGYLNSLDASIIGSILAYQANNCILGNLCEIGVHHGQLFFILALARRACERSLAIDLFEDDAVNSWSREHRARACALFINARRLGISLCEAEIYKTSSLDIDADDILNRTGGSIRFFSVDGGHSYEHVENDLLLAKRTLSSEGVIAVDDFFDQDWPEVTLATYDFLRGSDEIIPFLLSPGKIYLAPPHIAEVYQGAVRVATKHKMGQMVRFFNQEVYSIRESRLERALGLARGLAVRYGARAYHGFSTSPRSRLLTGWALDALRQERK